MRVFFGALLTCCVFCTHAYAIQVLEQKDFGEELGRGIGSGLSQGLELLINQKMADIQNQKQKQAFKNAQNKQYLIEAADYLIARKRQMGTITQDDTCQAALKYCIATDTEYQTALMMMQMLAAKLESVSFIG